jgi:glutaredoxin 3
MIFSKSYCPYCTKAKEAFDDMGISFGAVELDQVGGGGEIQAILLDMTGQRTVPSVWIKGQHIGGCDDTLAATSSGKIREMLK